MEAPEFSRPVDLRALPTQALALEASAEERAALAARFELVKIKALKAEITLSPTGEVVHATGRMRAQIVQSCAVSGEDLPVSIDEPLALRFIPQRQVSEEEIELAPDDLDEIAYAGSIFDLGEAVAQSLVLAIDPYATGPEAERVRAEVGLSTPEASGPFAALAALKKS